MNKANELHDENYENVIRWLKSFGDRIIFMRINDNPSMHIYKGYIGYYAWLPDIDCAIKFKNIEKILSYCNLSLKFDGDYLSIDEIAQKISYANIGKAICEDLVNRENMLPVFICERCILPKDAGEEWLLMNAELFAYGT